jgi:hypothetical protein
MPTVVIPSGARNLLLNPEKADSSALGFEMTGNFELTSYLQRTM